MIRASHWSGPGGHADNQDAFVVAACRAEPEWWVTPWPMVGGQPAAEAAQLACRTFLKQVAGRQAKQLSSPANWMTWLRSVDEPMRWIPWRDCAFVALAVSEVAVIRRKRRLCRAGVLLWRRASGADWPAAEKPARRLGLGLFHALCRGPGIARALLLCSDGVWKYAGWDTLLCLDSRQAGEALIATLRQKAMLPHAGACRMISHGSCCRGSRDFLNPGCEDSGRGPKVPTLRHSAKVQRLAVFEDTRIGEVLAELLRANV